MVGVMGRRENLLKELCSLNREKCVYEAGDITNVTKTVKQLNALHEKLGGLDLLILSAGIGEINLDLEYQLEEPTIHTNVSGFTNIVDWSYKTFETYKKGHLVVISSIAGIRGSGVAPAYNASKSYQSNYMEGMRQKAFKQHLPIHMTDIRPGFIDTEMAKGEGLFWVVPVNKAVNQIYSAITKRKKIVYVSKRWKYIAWALKIIPSCIYNRL